MVQTDVIIAALIVIIAFIFLIIFIVLWMNERRRFRKKQAELRLAAQNQEHSSLLD